MKESELRVYNLVNVFIEGSVKQGQVRTITDNLKAVVRIGSEWKAIKYKNIEGIRLTEEMLLKFGFNWNGLGKKWLTKFTPSGKAVVSIEDGFFKLSGRTKAIQIQYVHTLQNLYFALTGEELVLTKE